MSSWWLTALFKDNSVDISMDGSVSHFLPPLIFSQLVRNLDPNFNKPTPQPSGDIWNIHIKLGYEKHSPFFNEFLGYHEWMVTVEADDLIAVRVSLSWIPEKLSGSVRHQTLPHIARRGEAYIQKPYHTSHTVITLQTNWTYYLALV